LANPHGTPIWYEYLARDADQAQAFYVEVNGCRVDGSGMPGLDYRILTAPDGSKVGGLTALPPGAPMRPGWIGYFGVDDVDATVAQLEATGGRVHMPATTMEGIGRMAMVADPQGAAFYVMRGASDAESTSFRQSHNASPGHVVWNELLAPDQDASMAFYGSLFGWRHDGGMPIGPLGDYKFVHAGPVCLGASMKTPPGEASGWRFYVLVPDIDAGADRVRQAGGSVLQGPDPIPGGGCSLLAEDPFGARFGLVGPRG
jgi:predicted enzyme related to lactoylglutathione lyase